MGIQLDLLTVYLRSHAHKVPHLEKPLLDERSNHLQKHEVRAQEIGNI